MQIKQIHSMRWATPEQTFVAVIADTNTGDNEQIATPYNDTSVIWDVVQAFPESQIAAHVEPPPPKPERPWPEGVRDYRYDKDTLSWTPFYVPAKSFSPL